MPSPSPKPPLSLRRLIWAMIAYLIFFAAFLSSVSYLLLLPMMLRARDATPDQQQMLKLVSILLLIAVLAISFGGLVLTFRLARRAAE